MKNCINLDALRCLNKSKPWFGSLELWWSLSHLMKSLLRVSFILRLRTDKQEHQEVTYQTFRGNNFLYIPKGQIKISDVLLIWYCHCRCRQTITENNPIKQCSLLLREELENLVLVLTTASNQARTFFLAIRYTTIAFYLTEKNLSNTYLASEKTQIILGDIPAQYSK